MLTGIEDIKELVEEYVKYSKEHEELEADGEYVEANILQEEYLNPLRESIADKVAIALGYKF
jgi:hypothetical protein